MLREALVQEVLGKVSLTFRAHRQVLNSVVEKLLSDKSHCTVLQGNQINWIIILGQMILYLVSISDSLCPAHP